MNKRQLISILIIGISTCLSFCPVLAETIYPISSKEELQSLVETFNKQGIRISYDRNVSPNIDEKIDSVTENGEFYIEGADGGYKLFKVDINNDGEPEYVKTMEAGSGRFFDIETIYKSTNGKFVDIYDEIKLPMRKLIRDADKEAYDLEDGYAGHVFGDIIVEKKDGKVYFSILEGRPERPEENINSFNVSNQFRAYEFLWADKDIKLTRAHDRLLKESDFFEGIRR